MSEAAPQAAAGHADGARDLETVSRALEALRLAWGDKWLFGHDEKGYWAAGRPGSGIRRAGTPEELGELLVGGSGPASP